MDDVSIMKLVLQEAANCIENNESPFAAGLFIDNRLYIESNKSRTLRNPNLHAEIVVINEYCRKYTVDSLERAVIYSNCEPCPMCLHAIVNVGIKKIVFASTIGDAIRYGSGDILINTIDYALKYGLEVDIIGEFMRDEANEIFKKCIKERGEL